MSPIFSILHINEEEVSTCKKTQWKTLIKEKTREHCKENLLIKMKKYKKYDYLQHKEDNFKIGSFMKNLVFRHVSKMILHFSKLSIPSFATYMFNQVSSNQTSSEIRNEHK